MTEAAPPSYDSLYGKVTNALGDKPTPEKLNEVMVSLSDDEKKVLGDYDPSQLTPDEKKAFDQGFQDYMKTEEAKRRMEISADKATEAAKAIDASFQALVSKIKNVDQMGLSTTEFGPRVDAIFTKYRTALAASVAFATSTAAYAQHWERTVLKIILTTVPMTIKKAMLDAHILAASALEKAAVQLQDQFTEIGKDLAGVQADFSTLGDETKNANAAEISKLSGEIATLNSDILDLQKKLLATAIAGGILSVGCWLLGPFGPMAFLIGAGITIGLCLKFAAEIKDKENQKTTKDDRIKALQAQNEAIDKARVELVTLGEQNLKAFNENTGIIQSVFRYAANDAVKIQAKLNNPLFLQDLNDLDKDSRKVIQEMVLGEIGYMDGIYETMATYLNRYADGVTKADIHG